MTALQRLTTEYIETEDRFRISGEGINGKLHTFWLTQRLLYRLVRYLVSALEKKPPASTAASRPADDRTNALFNEMAQQSAQQQLDEQPPVLSLEDNSWLVSEVDIGKADNHVKLRFKNSAVETVELMLDQSQLRQWLAIVCKLSQQAEWPMEIWPEWMRNSTTQAGTESKSPIH